MTESAKAKIQSESSENKTKKRPFTAVQQAFCDKLYALRDQSGYSRQKLSEHVDFSCNSIGFYEKSRLPNIDFIVNLAHVLELNPMPLVYERIIHGQGLPEAIKRFDTEFKQSGFTLNNNSKPQDCDLLPTVKTQDQLETKLQLLNYISENQHIKMMQQHGDSMAPKYEANSWLFVDCKETPLVEGNIYMFEYSKDPQEKQQTGKKSSAFRIQFGFDNELILSYENPKFRPITLDSHSRQAIKLIGEVKGAINIQL